MRTSKQLFKVSRSEISLERSCVAQAIHGKRFVRQQEPGHQNLTPRPSKSFNPRPSKREDDR